MKSEQLLYWIIYPIALIPLFFGTHYRYYKLKLTTSVKWDYKTIRESVIVSNSFLAIFYIIIWTVILPVFSVKPIYPGPYGITEMIIFVALGYFDRFELNKENRDQTYFAKITDLDEKDKN